MAKLILNLPILCLDIGVHYSSGDSPSNSKFHYFLTPIINTSDNFLEWGYLS